jgi:hypothetical protein
MPLAPLVQLFPLSVANTASASAKSNRIKFIIRSASPLSDCTNWVVILLRVSDTEILTAASIKTDATAKASKSSRRLKPLQIAREVERRKLNFVMNLKQNS